MKTSEANIEDLKGMVVSDGTMRSEDLIPKFLNVLKVYGRDVYDKYVGENPEVLDLSGMDDETMGWVVDELFDKLNEIAPEGYSFGSQDGDGACYGFWSVDADERKKCEAYIQPVTLYSTTRYDDAEAVQSFLRDIGGDAVTVDKQRNGDVLSVNVSGSDDDVEAFVDTYKNEYGSIVKDCGVDATGWTAPEDIYYIATEQGRKELRGESKKSEDFDMNKAFFQAKKAITDWTKRQGHKTLEWLYTDGRKSPTSYPSGIWDFEWDTGNGMATAELKVSPYETRTNSWNDRMDFSLRVGTEDKPTVYTSVEDVLYALDTLISKTEIKMESKKSETKEDKPVWGVTVEYTLENGETRRTDVAPSCYTEERAREAAIARVTKDYGPLKDVKIIRVDRLPEWAARNIRDLVRNNKTESMSNRIENTTITEQEFSDILNAYVKEVEGNDIKPIRIEVLKTEPVEGDGTLIKLHYDARENGWSNARTYVLVFGDLHKNRDNDLIYVLHDWQSGEKVTPEDIADHDWELVNNHIRPSEILDATKSSESLDPSLDVKGRGVVELSEDDYLKLSRDINSRGYCKDKDGGYNVWIGGSFKGTFPSVEAAADAGYTLVEGKRCEAQVSETTFKQGVDEFIGAAPEGGWSDYWAMQQDWEFYKDSLCRDGVITQKQADSWSNPCTPDTFDRWQTRNGLVRRGYESKKSEARPTKQEAQIKELCKLCRNDKNVAESVFKALTKDYNTSLDPVLAGQYLTAKWKSKLEELGGCNGWYDGFKKLYAAMGSDFVCSVLQDLTLGSSGIGCGACITIVRDIYDKVVKRNESKKPEDKEYNVYAGHYELIITDKVLDTPYELIDSRPLYDNLEDDLLVDYPSATIIYDQDIKDEVIANVYPWLEGESDISGVQFADFSEDTVKMESKKSEEMTKPAIMLMFKDILDTHDAERVIAPYLDDNYRGFSVSRNPINSNGLWLHSYNKDPKQAANILDWIKANTKNLVWGKLTESKKSEGSIRDTKCVQCGSSPAMFKLDGCSGNFCLSCAKEFHWVCPKHLKDKVSHKKSESLTLKQKELKDMARYGEAEDITTISDVEAKELKKKGIETVGISRGAYGMNGALLRDSEGKKYVITARSSNLFYFV